MLDYAINEVKTPVIIRYSKEKITKDVVKYQYLPKWMMEGEGSTTIIT